MESPTNFIEHLVDDIREHARIPRFILRTVLWAVLLWVVFVRAFRRNYRAFAIHAAKFPTVISL